MAKKFDPSVLAARTQQASEAMAQSDRAHEAQQLRHRASSALRALGEIKPRSAGDTRKLRPSHVVALAESIAALGLVEPLVVDANGELLAGGHRLFACRLLDPEQRAQRAHELLKGLPAPLAKELGARIEALGQLPSALDLRAIPVRAFEFAAQQDPEAALAIEVSENTQRVDYSPQEVRALYDRLIERGYTDHVGRPNAQQKPARPVLATVLGRSLRTVRRMLAGQEKLGHVSAFPAQPDPQEAARQRALKSLQKLAQARQDALDSLGELDQDDLHALRKGLERDSIWIELAQAIGSFGGWPQPTLYYNHEFPNN